MFNITTRNLSLTTPGWYNSIDDETNQLFYKLLVMSPGGKYFLVMPYTFQLETFLVQLPHIDSETYYAEALVGVYAMDKDGAVAFRD